MIEKLNGIGLAIVLALIAAVICADLSAFAQSELGVVTIEISHDFNGDGEQEGLANRNVILSTTGGSFIAQSRTSNESRVSFIVNLGQQYLATANAGLAPNPLYYRKCTAFFTADFSGQTVPMTNCTIEPLTSILLPLIGFNPG